MTRLLAPPNTLNGLSDPVAIDLPSAFTTLDSAPLTITLNRTYRVRLEAIGTRLRLFVDNQLEP